MIKPSHIAQFDVFSNLRLDEIEVLAYLASNKTFQGGEAMVTEGDPAKTLYIIEKGRAAVELHVSRGSSATVANLGPGELVGWSALIPPHRYTATVRCLEDVEAIAFDAEKLRQEIDADPALGRTVMRAVASVVSQRLDDTRLQLADYMHG